MGYDEGLADDVGTLEMGKASLKFAFCDEFLGQGDLAGEGDVLNGIHELLSVAT
jgi:hypothetical protein